MISNNPYLATMIDVGQALTVRVMLPTGEFRYDVNEIRETPLPTNFACVAGPWNPLLNLNSLLTPVTTLRTDT